MSRDQEVRPLNQRQSYRTKPPVGLLLKKKRTKKYA